MDSASPTQSPAALPYSGFMCKGERCSVHAGDRFCVGHGIVWLVIDPISWNKSSNSATALTLHVVPNIV